jgi:hypothetical protein
MSFKVKRFFLALSDKLLAAKRISRSPKREGRPSSLAGEENSCLRFSKDAGILLNRAIKARPIRPESGFSAPFGGDGDE